MRKAAKRDKNEFEIVEALVTAGATVARLSAAGAPDLLVGYHGVTYLLEIKDKHGQLTSFQQIFMNWWDGSPITVVRTVDHALAAIGAIK